MDDRLAALERAFRERPGDPDRALELARAYLRAARPARALTVSRPHGASDVRLAAARALGERLGRPFLGISPRGFETFSQSTSSLQVLIPGGAFLEDGLTGGSAAASLVLPGGSRAALRPVTLPDFLIGGAPAPAPDREEAALAASAAGGRLARAAEWKKAWRGGVYLDGDETASWPNPLPDRVFPGEGPGGVESSYGVRFDPRFAEWQHGPRDELLILDGTTGRYRAPRGRSQGRRRAAWRLVVELPADV